MFRKTAMVMTTMAVLAFTADSALARGGRHGCGGGGCGGGGCGSSCGAGGCGGGGCAAPACGSCAAAPAAPAKPCATCTGGSCAPAGKYAAAPATTAPATITVSLPADAKLTIDGQATTSTSASRTFVTPNLEDGKQYSYTIQMEVVRDGKPRTVSQDVIVQAGKESKITLTVPAETVAAK